MQREDASERYSELLGGIEMQQQLQRVKLFALVHEIVSHTDTYTYTHTHMHREREEKMLNIENTLVYMSVVALMASSLSMTCIHGDIAHFFHYVFLFFSSVNVKVSHDALF